MSRRRRDHVVVLAFAAVALARCFPAMLWPLTPDEAGFLLVARHWDPVPGHLFGEFWVDRPPQLIATFLLGDTVAGPYGPRLLVAALSVAAVLSAYRIGTLLGGPRAARWTAALVLMITSWPHLISWAAKSESLGVPFVLMSCWLFVEARHRAGGRGALVVTFLAGFAAALAVGMKQSLLGGAVFGAVLLVTGLLTGRLTLRGFMVNAAVALAGFLAPVAVSLTWVVAAGLSPALLWEVVYGFRVEALDAISNVASPANAERAIHLALIAVGSGLAIVLVWFLLVLPRIASDRRDVTIATVALLVVDVSGLVLGGSYWPAYLQALVPSAALAMALICLLPRARGTVPRVAVPLSAVPLLASLVLIPTLREPDTETTATGVTVGRAVRHAAHPDDSIVVIYGAPQIVWASGLHAPYQHLWSLPVRTLDPDLDQLYALLSGPEAPTWIVVRGPVDTWGLDRSGRVRDVVGERYERVSRLCTISIWRLRSATRPAVQPLDCSRRFGPLDGE